MVRWCNELTVSDKNRIQVAGHAVELAGGGGAIGSCSCSGRRSRGHPIPCSCTARPCTQGGGETKVQRETSNNPAGKWRENFNEIHTHQHVSLFSLDDTTLAQNHHHPPPLLLLFAPLIFSQRPRVIEQSEARKWRATPFSCFIDHRVIFSPSSSVQIRISDEWREIEEKRTRWHASTLFLHVTLFSLFVPLTFSPTVLIKWSGDQRCRKIRRNHTPWFARRSSSPTRNPRTPFCYSLLLWPDFSVRRGERTSHRVVWSMSGDARNFWKLILPRGDVLLSRQKGDWQILGSRTVVEIFFQFFATKGG